MLTNDYNRYSAVQNAVILYDVIGMFWKGTCCLYHNVRKTNQHSDATLISEYIYLKEEHLG